MEIQLGLPGIPSQSLIFWVFVLRQSSKSSSPLTSPSPWFFGWYHGFLKYLSFLICLPLTNLSILLPAPCAHSQALVLRVGTYQCLSHLWNDWHFFFSLKSLCLYSQETFPRGKSLTIHLSLLVKLKLPEDQRSDILFIAPEESRLLESIFDFKQSINQLNVHR